MAKSSNRRKLPEGWNTGVGKDEPKNKTSSLGVVDTIVDLLNENLPTEQDSIIKEVLTRVRSGRQQKLNESTRAVEELQSGLSAFNAAVNEGLNTPLPPDPPLQEG